MIKPHYPERIICLTEEPTEWLYMLGQQHRIVGISGFTVRPKQARKEKPKVSAFTSAKIDKILALKPDLVIGFSDMQADIASALIKAEIAVIIYNQRSIQEIFNTLLSIASLVGAQMKAIELLNKINDQLSLYKVKSQQLTHKPKVYFEEWNDPLMGGIQWVNEIIELCGGKLIFPEHKNSGLGKDRIIADTQTVIDRQPDIIIASWCGKKVRPESIMNRPGWEAIPAVINQQIYEIKSADILQPGPAALTDGVRQIFEIIHN
ncbi:MAG: ABC transporter substrate-binding protein [bacterium]